MTHLPGNFNLNLKGVSLVLWLMSEFAYKQCVAYVLFPVLPALRFWSCVLLPMLAVFPRFLCLLLSSFIAFPFLCLSLHLSFLYFVYFFPSFSIHPSVVSCNPFSSCHTFTTAAIHRRGFGILGGVARGLDASIYLSVWPKSQAQTLNSAFDSGIASARLRTVSLKVDITACLNLTCYHNLAEPKRDKPWSKTFSFLIHPASSYQNRTPSPPRSDYQYCLFFRPCGENMGEKGEGYRGDGKRRDRRGETGEGKGVGILAQGLGFRV